MEHKESPLLALTVQHRSKVGVVVQYSMSHLSDFTGLLYQDSFSHTHLNLSLIQASGTIDGVITGAHASQSIRLRLSEHHSNSTHQVKLTSIECLANEVTITLRPLSFKNGTISKKIPCIYESIRSFRFSPGSRQPVDGGPGAVPDCISCGTAWLHWLDPQQWMDTVWPQTRVVILVTMISLGIIIMVILCKVIRHLHQCLSLPKMGNEKNNIGDLVLSEIQRACEDGFKRDTACDEGFKRACEKEMAQ